MVDSARQNNMRHMILAGAILLSACSGDAPAAPKRLRDKETTSIEAGGHLDGLTLTLTLEETIFKPGETIHGVLHVANRSGVTITDPSCFLHAQQRGVVSRADPDAELWQRIQVDCAGRVKIPDGYNKEYDSVDIQANNRYGDQLPEGEYNAALELPGFSERLEIPIVLEGEPTTASRGP